METNNGIIYEILDIDLSKVSVGDINHPSLMEDFPNKKPLEAFTELRVMQLVLSRKAIIEKSGYLGEQLSKGEYLSGVKGTSNWTIYKLNDGSDRIGVLWSHYDDDSWSVFFKGDNLEIDYLYYEN
ncbi:MAG: hypothetical protein RIC95_09330 [Vicingaceae bacterium]